MLKEVDRKAPWFKNLKTTLDEVNTQKAYTKQKVDDMHNKDRNFQLRIEAAAKWKDTIPAQKETHDRLLVERKCYADESGMLAWQNLLKSIDELLEAGAKYLKDSGCKPEGESSYLFLQSHRVDGGVAFRVEHSGIELTNAGSEDVCCPATHVSGQQKSSVLGWILRISPGN